MAFSCAHSGAGKTGVVPSYQRIEFHIDSILRCTNVEVYFFNNRSRYHIRKYKLENKLFNRAIINDQYSTLFITQPDPDPEFLYILFTTDELKDSIDITKGLFTTVYMQPLQSEVIGQPNLSEFSATFKEGPAPTTPIDHWPYHFSSNSLPLEEKIYTDENIVFYPEHSLHADGCSKWYLDQQLISTDDTLRWKFPQKSTYRLRSVSVSSSLKCPEDSIVSEIDLKVFDRKDFVFWDTILQSNLLQISDTFLSHEEIFLTDTIKMQIPVVVQDTTIEIDTLYIHDTLFRNRNSPEPIAKFNAQAVSPFSSFSSSSTDAKKGILSPLVIVPCQQHIYLFADTTIPVSGLFSLCWNAALKMDSSLRRFVYASLFKPNDTRVFLSDYIVAFGFTEYYKNGVFSSFLQVSYPIEYIKDTILGELVYACKKSCHIHNDSQFYEVISYENENYLPPRHLKHKERPLHLSLHYGESRTSLLSSDKPRPSM